MKTSNYIIAIICSLLIAGAFIFNEEITNKIVEVLDSNPTIVIKKSNEYTKDYDFDYVKLDKTYTPYGYQDLLNIIYSVLNNGWDNFTFYCPDEYTDCISDMTTISTDNNLLTNINNFVHPFNNFEHIKTTFDSTGEITLTITKLYTDEEITEIKNAISEFTTNNIPDNMTDYEKIETYHDYIIDNTTYDIERAQIGKSNYKSNTAYGTLIEGYSVCGGYSDAIAIYLFQLGIKNFKISSDDHVWNAIYLNDEWLHLDATWDDPYGSDGASYLIDDYFLITTEKLQKLDNQSHNFDISIYQEFK
ncbi:MAG TPA: hypothetical protein PLX66_02450 [Bacilli bacterium]|nr:hypothetical protein [Bacilli bacterium]